MGNENSNLKIQNKPLFLSLKDISKKHNIIFPLEYLNYESTIIEIFNGNFNNTNISDPIILNVLGTYYGKYKELEFSKKYHLMALDLGHHKALNGLGNYYLKIKDYPEMMKHYLLAISFGNCCAMYNTGLHYLEIIPKWKNIF